MKSRGVLPLTQINDEKNTEHASQCITCTIANETLLAMLGEKGSHLNSLTYTSPEPNKIHGCLDQIFRTSRVKMMEQCEPQDHSIAAVPAEWTILNIPPKKTPHIEEKNWANTHHHTSSLALWLLQINTLINNFIELQSQTKHGTSAGHLYVQQQMPG